MAVSAGFLFASCSHRKMIPVSVPQARVPRSLPPSSPAGTPPRRPAPKQEAAAVPGVPASPQPALVELLSDRERDELAKAIDARLLSTQQNVASYRSKPLTTQQIREVERIDVLIRQAQEAKNSDLRTAKNIADRAYLLSQALPK